MKVVQDFLGLFARIVALVVTAAFLVATSYVPENCDTWAAPITFRAVGTCGPGGLIVVDRGSGDRRIVIHNAAAIGLPPLAVPNSTVQALHQNFCPSDFDQGRWSVQSSVCLARTGGPIDASAASDSGSTDAGDDAGLSPSDGAAPREVPGCLYNECETAVSNTGELLFSCFGVSRRMGCQSRLTVVE